MNPRQICLTNRLSRHLLTHNRKRSSRSLMSARRAGLLRKNRRNTDKKLVEKIRAGIKRLKEEMAEIGEEQKCIKEGQRQVREKFEKMEAERDQLWKEAELISKQNAGIQARLRLMFGIVKARAQNDYESTARLTQDLRDLMARRDEQMD